MLSLLAAGHACGAQQYSFDQVTEGLGDLNVNSIAQDRTGYLWLGTENGLYRYDGSQFQQFGAASGLHARTIQCLFVGPDGTLFAGTTAGIYFQRKDGSFSEVRPPDSAQHFSQRIGTVFTAEAPDRIVAAGRNDAYLLRRTGPEQWIATPLHLSRAPVWSVLYTPGGGLWYGCGHDLCFYKDGKTSAMAALLHLPADRWLHLLRTRDGHLWIRGQMHLGEVFPEENRYEPRDLPGVPDAVPYAGLVQDSKGRIAASQGSSLGIWNQNRWRMITDHNGLSRYDISALFVDGEDSLWLGVVGHGFTRWVGQDRWEAYTTADGLSDNIVWASLRDRLGRLWIGTESGLDWMPAGKSTVRAWKQPGVQTARAVALAESPDGSIWMGSAAGGLTRIDVKTLAARIWKVPEVYRLLMDGQHLWVATARGLYVADTAAPNPAPHLVTDAAFPHPQALVTGLTLDRAQRLWAVCEGKLYQLGAGGWRRTDIGSRVLHLVQIAADPRGDLWATGTFPGVMRLQIDGNRIIRTEAIGRPRLLSDQVVALLVDHRGWLWIAQDAGLTLFDGHSWRSFTRDDGLIWNDLDAYALTEDADGSLWVGTSAGLAHLLQPELLPATVLRAPAIAQMQYGATAIASGASVRWRASPLAVSLAPLSFSEGHPIHFRYRLLGLEKEWVETDEDTVRYPLLDPGKYRFQVMTVDMQGGNAISPVSEVVFRVTPQWWQSWELRVALVLLAILGIVVAWKWRMRLLLQQKRHLETAVHQRTESLEREKAQLMHTREQMRHYAEHDDLTALWNHRIIIDRFRGEVDRSQRDGSALSVILVDLDHFKRINDSFGHMAGDIVLKHVSAIFQRMVRSYDWVGRYGGEEFLLILPGTSFINARLRAEQLRLAVQSAQITDEDRPIHITASFGVASGYPADYESLIRAADTALYRAKDNGRNCVVATEIEPEHEAPGI